MKRFHVLLIACLLAGCTAHAQSLDQTAYAHQAVSLLDEGSTLEVSTKGAISCYPLGQLSYNNILSFSDSILLVASTEDTTFFQKLDSSTGVITNSLELPFPLIDNDPCLSIHGSSIVCHDTINQQTLVIDDLLQIICRIPDPDGLVGIPLLSEDRNTLYYCTAASIRALDIKSGISRVLKESTYPVQTVSEILLQDSVLHCRLEEAGNQRSLFLCTNTGNTLGVSDKIQHITSWETHFCASLEEGKNHPIIFGNSSNSQSLILPEYGTSTFILSNPYQILSTVPLSAGKIQLNLYDLQTGLRTASLNLSASGIPRSAVSLSDGSIWFLKYDENYGCDTLYRWNPELSPIIDPMRYTSSHFTREAPDQPGIETCNDYVQKLVDTYGIDIRIFKGVNELQTADFRITYEHIPKVLMWELEQLEKNLNNYPEEFLQTIVQRFGGLSICIARDTYSATSQCVPDRNCGSALFWNGSSPCIVLVAGFDTQKGLHHSLCHLIDTIVLGGSSAYDTWDQNNPTGFSYDYDYVANEARNSTAFLLDSNRYFVDMYSMSFPKEDRARIMEYAMTSEHSTLFQTEAMQNKLRTICVGIREAFHMEQCTDTFLWEQYLHKPLAPST